MTGSLIIVGVFVIGTAQSQAAADEDRHYQRIQEYVSGGHIGFVRYGENQREDYHASYIKGDKFN